MPRVLSYTPPWLSRPAPGFNLLSTTPSSESSPSEPHAPSRLIAHRGTEIFVAVKNELRWSDLLLLRENWETEGRSDQDNTSARHYRLLKVPTHGDIQQLVISPAGDYLAILTSHTVHIAILPSSSHLSSTDSGPLRLKSFQLGPTSHVLDRSPVVVALWHPLCANSNSLVTITADAVVRLWELDKDNRWSFNTPTLPIDLKRLANATNTSYDFSPSEWGVSAGFSPDVFELQVAAACFGGSADQTQDPCAAMTLWLAMREGDIYALCPFLPAKVAMSTPFVSNLTSSIRLRADSSLTEKSTSKRADDLYHQRATWVADFNAQMNAITDASQPLNHLFLNIYTRPSRPGPVPMLQGPFRFTPDNDQISEITDIFVMPSINDQLSSEPGDDPEFGQGEDISLPIDIVCIATSTANIHVAIHCEQVQPSWLPSALASKQIDHKSEPVVPDESAELIVVESITLGKQGQAQWPVFTTDVASPYALFVSHAQGVSHFNLLPWARKLEEELSGTFDAGSAFRLDLIVESDQVIVDHTISFRTISADTDHAARVTACINLKDSDLGHFLLTQAYGQPQAAELDSSDLDLLRLDDANDYVEGQMPAFVPNESRPVYQPPQELWAETQLKVFVNQHLDVRYRNSARPELNLSPKNLNLMMEAHRILSYETHQLGLAAADLFRRCERLQSEFQAQIKRANQVATQIDSVLDEDRDLYDDEGSTNGDVGSSAEIQRRLENVKSRQGDLTDRYEELRRKCFSFNGRPLNQKETKWVEEIKAATMLITDDPTLAETSTELEMVNGDTTARFDAVQALAQQLLEQSASRLSDNASTKDDTTEIWSPKRKAPRSAQITAMLERETALVDATRIKLEKLALLPV